MLNYLSDAYTTYAASVLAGNAFMRSSFGAVFPLFATQMYHKLGVGWASTLLALLAVIFIPIPFVLYKVCPSLSSFHLSLYFAYPCFVLDGCSSAKGLDWRARGRDMTCDHRVPM